LTGNYDVIHFVADSNQRLQAQRSLNIRNVPDENTSIFEKCPETLDENPSIFRNCSKIQTLKKEFKIIIF
jgi:hypothetical protein